MIDIIKIIRSSLSFFLYKQKTAYEMRISDWCSDVCSSDLDRRGRRAAPGPRPGSARRGAGSRPGSRRGPWPRPRGRGSSEKSRVGEEWVSMYSFRRVLYPSKKKRHCLSYLCVRTTSVDHSSKSSIVRISSPSYTLLD